MQPSALTVTEALEVASVFCFSGRIVLASPCLNRYSSLSCPPPSIAQTSNVLYKNQVSSYAERKNMDLETCEKWLSPILNYDRD